MNKEDKELLAQAGAKKVVNTKVVEIREEHACYSVETKSTKINFEQFKSDLLHAIQENFSYHPTIVSLRKGERVNEAELAWLDDFFIERELGPQLCYLKAFFPESTAGLDQIMRTIIGLDATSIEGEFTVLVKQLGAQLNSKQQRFIVMLKNHLCRYGSVDIEQLYDAPFNQIDDAGLDGVFPISAQADVVEQFVRRFSVHLGEKQASVEKVVN